MIWTEEKVEELKKLLAEGLSASQVGAILGTTKGSVIGKAGRIGVVLNFRRKPPKEDMPPEKLVQLTHTPKPQPASPKVYPPLTILELNDKTCKWPLTDRSPWLFCGKLKNEFVSFCPDHCKIGYRPQPPRSR